MSGDVTIGNHINYYTDAAAAWTLLQPAHPRQGRIRAPRFLWKSHHAYYRPARSPAAVCRCPRAADGPGARRLRPLSPAGAIFRAGELDPVPADARWGAAGHAH